MNPTNHTPTLASYQIASHIDQQGRCCPLCQSGDITRDAYDHDGSTIIQAVTCLSCGAQWADCFKLVNVWLLRAGATKA